MIRNENEYKAAVLKAERDREIAQQQRKALAAAGLTSEEVDRAMGPLLVFQSQLQDELAWYENARRRCFPPVNRLSGIGHLLIALRIAVGITQRELAERLGISESAVSRDERNEYHGITLERADRILDALGETVILTVQDKSRYLEQELMSSLATQSSSNIRP